MPRLAVGLIGPLPPPFAGMANQCQQLAALLRSDGLDIHMVRTNAPYRPAWVGRIWGLRGLFRLLPYIHALWRAAGCVDLFHVFANSGWAWHLIAAPAILIARIRRLPVIVNYRGGGAEAFFARAPLWAKLTLAAADSLVVPSGFLAEVFQRLGCTAAIIPNVIDLERFRPRARLNVNRAPHIIVTRNLEPIYDIQTAIRAFALVRERLSDATMTVAGTGSELPALRDLCATLGVAGAVTFAGHLDNLQIAALHQTADLMLNPTLVDNMPISVLEAFASNVPVVSTTIGGVPFIADNERTALLVAPGDAAALAEAALRILCESGLADRLTRAAQEEVQRYSWSAVRDLWLIEYKRVIGANVSPVAVV